jgi:molecular chaperone DnaJ
MSKKDFYEILGVDKKTSKEDIKKAYRKLAMQFHPDRNPGAENEAKFKEVSEAASVLLDEEKRKKYDQFGHAGVDNQGGGFGGGFGGFEGFTDLGDIFGDIFGDIMGGNRGRRKASRARQGRDLQMDVDVTFEEAAFGVEKTISVKKHAACKTCTGSGAAAGSKAAKCDFCQGMGEVRRQQGFFTVSSTCPKCHGSGETISNPCKDCRGQGLKETDAKLSVKIPAGIDEGQRLKLTNEGDAGQFGGPNGDLYVNIVLKEHEIFDREGFDVFCTLPISFSQAALGAEIDVPTLSGRVSLNIPAGTQSGKKMRLKGKGITKLGGYGLGDQIVNIHVETPTKITAEHREIFSRLSALEEKGTNPMSKGFFEKVKELFQ